MGRIMKNITPILFLILIIAIIGISGCLGTEEMPNTTSSPKHFNNGTIAFDCPGNMNIRTETDGTIIVEDDMAYGCIIQFIKYPYGPSHKLMDFETYINSDAYGFNFIEKNKTIISGKPAYKASEKIPTAILEDPIYKINGKEIVRYITIIDMKSGIIIISPTLDPQTNNQRDSFSYKAYESIVNSIQIK